MICIKGDIAKISLSSIRDIKSGVNIQGMGEDNQVVLFEVVCFKKKILFLFVSFGFEGKSKREKVISVIIVRTKKTLNFLQSP